MFGTNLASLVLYVSSQKWSRWFILWLWNLISAFLWLLFPPDNRTLPSRSVSQLSYSSVGSGSGWGPQYSSSSYLPGPGDSSGEEEQVQPFPFDQSQQGALSHTSQESLNSPHPPPQVLSSSILIWNIRKVWGLRMLRTTSVIGSKPAVVTEKHTTVSWKPPDVLWVDCHCSCWFMAAARRVRGRQQRIHQWSPAGSRPRRSRGLLLIPYRLLYRWLISTQKPFCGIVHPHFAQQRSHKHIKMSLI